VLEATSTSPVVRVAVDASDQGEVAIGNRVTITLPNNKTTPGVVSAIGRVATRPSAAGAGSSPPGGGSSGSSAATITVTVSPSHPSAVAQWDKASVQVGITTARVPHALAVPVTALLADVGGGYDVEVVDSAGASHLVRVSLGLFDDAAGLVQVTGAGLAAGQRVVVAST
jgi:hypothetical protein